MHTGRRMDWGHLAVFLLLAFGISWAIWIAIDRLGLPWWTALLASWGPGIAALLVRGPLLKEGFRDSGLLRLGSGPGARNAYLVAFLLTAVAAIASTGLGLAVGAFQLDWSPLRGMASPALIVAYISSHLGLTALLLSFVVVPFLPVFDLGEEIGWRDYLLLRLLPLGQVRAYLISGAVWAVWHLPYNVVLGFNNGTAGFALFALYIFLYGALLAHLRLRSGSVWPCAILHAAGNYQPYVLLALTLVRPGFSSAGPEQSMAIFLYATTMLAGVVAVILAVRSDRRPPAEPLKPTPGSPSSRGASSGTNR
jgi:membrane protease YdiL (CAAX protease family)